MSGPPTLSKITALLENYAVMEWYTGYAHAERDRGDDTPGHSEEALSDARTKILREIQAIISNTYAPFI